MPGSSKAFASCSNIYSLRKRKTSLTNGEEQAAKKPRVEKKISSKSREEFVREWLTDVHERCIQWEICQLRMLDQTFGSLKIPLLSDDSKFSKRSTDVVFKGHYNRRSDFQLIRKNKSVIQQLDLIFQRNAVTNNDLNSSSAGVQNTGCNPNNVVLLGQAGVGKTTLTRIILDKVVKKELLPNTRYVFFIPFRSMDFEKSHSFSQFVLGGANRFVGQGAVSDEELKDELGDGENVLFIHDGLDEADTSAFADSNPLPSDQTLATADVYVKKLLSNELLPKAIKVVTSRPKHFKETCDEYRPSTVIEVLGFDESARRELCRQFCKNEDVFNQVTDFLDGNPVMSASCYVAAKCVWIMYVLKQNVVEHGRVRAVSFTDVLVQGLGLYARGLKLRNKHELLKKISILAMSGFDQGRATFTLGDLVENGLESNVLKRMCETVSDKGHHVNLTIVDSGRTCFYFSHFIWQELLAAVHLLLFTSLKDFSSLLKRLDSSKWEVVAMLVYGLCNKTVFRRVGKIFKVCDDDLMKKKRNKLRILVKKLLQDLDPCNTPKLLTVCSWLNEMKHEEVTQDVLKYFPSELNLSGSLVRTDIPALVYALRSCQESVVLKIICKDSKFHKSPSKKVRLGDGCLQELLKSLAGTKLKAICRFSKQGASFQGSIAMVNDERSMAIVFDETTNYDLILPRKSRQRHLETSAANVWDLDKSDQIKLRGLITGISNHCLAALHAKMPAFNRNMQQIAYYPNVKGAFEDLLPCYCYAIKANSRTILSQLPLQRFELRQVLKRDHCKLMSGVFSATDVVVLSGCSLNAACADAIASCLNQSGAFLQELDLSHNRIGNKGAKQMATALDRIERLKVKNCRLTHTGIRFLTKACKNRQNRVALLDVSGNVVGETRSSFVKFLDKIDSLRLSDCALNHDGIEELVRSCRSLETSMRSLDLSNNNLSNIGAASLCKALRNIDRLNLSKCGLTSEGINKLAEVYKELDNPVEHLNLTQNGFGKAAFDVVKNCLKNIKELILTKYVVTCHGLQEDGEVVSKRRLKANVGLEDNVKSVCIRGKDGHCQSADVMASVLSLCVDRVDEVTMHDCSLTSVGVGELCYAIGKRTIPLTSLDLSGNKVGDSGAAVLAKALHNIDRLNLSGCAMTSKGISELAQSYQTLPKPKKSWNISHNIFGKSTFHDLVSCKKNLKELVVTQYKVTRDDVVEVGEETTKGNLQCNVVPDDSIKSVRITRRVGGLKGDESAALLSICLDQLDEVTLDYCSITSVGVGELATAIKLRTVPLKLLDLSRNYFRGDGLSPFWNVVNNVDSLILRECCLSSDAIVQLANALQGRERTLSLLDISKNYITENGMIPLHRVLNDVCQLRVSGCRLTVKSVAGLVDICKSRPTPMELLDLSCNKLGNQVVAVLVKALHNISRLELSQCDVTSDGIIELFQAYEQQPGQIKSVNIGGNIIGCKAFTALSSCKVNVEEVILTRYKVTSSDVVEDSQVTGNGTLPQIVNISSDVRSVKVKSFHGKVAGDVKAAVMSLCLRQVDELIMSDCYLTCTGLNELIYAINQRTSPMSHLDLNSNDFRIEGEKVIATAVQKIDSLNLSFSRIAPYGYSHLSNAIKQRETRMKYLVVSDVGDIGVKHLATALHKIDSLQVRKGFLTLNGFSYLVEACKRLESPLSKLDIVRNSIGDGGAQLFASVLHKVKSLRLHYCDIKEAGTVALAEACGRLETPMEEFDLSSNCIGGEGAKSVGSALNKMRRLDVGYCRMTRHEVAHLSEGLLRLSHPIHELVLSCNRIGDDGAKLLASAIDKVDRLNLYYCGIQDEGLKALTDSIKRRNVPLDYLNLGYNNFKCDSVAMLVECLHKIRELDVKSAGFKDVAKNALRSAAEKLNPAPTVDM